MYTGQLDISEGSLPQLAATAQFLDMPLLEQLLQTHALAATTNNNTPSPTIRAARNSRTPLRGPASNYSFSNPKPTRGSKAELLPAGPSRIDLEVICYCRELWSAVMKYFPSIS